MSFTIGEVVDWLDAGDMHPEVTIIGPRDFDEWEMIDPREEDCREGKDYGYDVRYADGSEGFEPEKFLRRKPPKQSFEAGEWELCPWRPTEEYCAVNGEGK